MDPKSKLDFGREGDMVEEEEEEEGDDDGDDEACVRRIGSIAVGPFSDLDEPATLPSLMAFINDSSTSNFILDFTALHARVAFDQTLPCIRDWLVDAQPPEIPTRWLNIWKPFQQQQILALLATRYDFSPRLLALMCSDPKQPRSSRSAFRNESRLHRFWPRQWQGSRGRAKGGDHGEAGVKLDDLASGNSLNSSSELVAPGNIYQILDDIWHYSSVDIGRRYVCVGYNSLYSTRKYEESATAKGLGGDEEEEEDDVQIAEQGRLPHCLRLWTWLVLCDDSTVITIHEDPFPFMNEILNRVQQDILKDTRRNLASVFRSLSAVDRDSLMRHSPMNVFPIRTRLGDIPADQEAARSHFEGPGLLFYYIFENWHNSYTMVTRKESRYGSELEQLRQEMVQRPRLGQIERLDRIGKELGVLRRHYGSYMHIVDRLLEPLVQAARPLLSPHHADQALVLGTVGKATASFEPVRPVVVEKETIAAGFLSPAARVRFKRLRDLIDLYALDEVDEYIKQKDAMVAMNFSLIAVKQSHDVDRLTRITLLLTKATILFLPVNLMTAYFTVPLEDLQYTATTFWATFAGVFTLSWVALLIFGAFSGTLQAGEVWAVITKTIRRWMQRL